MAMRLIPSAAAAEEAYMESPAHRDRDLHPLSAAERADLRWGLERVLAQHEVGVPERDLARGLQQALRHLPVVMLHDRLLPSGLVVEHLAIGPGGATVIAGWPVADLPAPLTVERLHGIFGARADLLRDGAAADRTALVGPVLARVAGVREVIDDWVSVQGALCLDGDETTARLRPLVVAG